MMDKDYTTPKQPLEENSTDKTSKLRSSSEKRVVCYWICLGEQNVIHSLKISRIHPRESQLIPAA